MKKVCFNQAEKLEIARLAGYREIGHSRVFVSDAVATETDGINDGSLEDIFKQIRALGVQKYDMSENVDDGQSTNIQTTKKSGGIKHV